MQKFRLITLLFVFLTLTAFGKDEADKKNKKRPNILFLVVDDLKPVLGCYGNTDVKTPDIDRLAKKGVVFQNAYCQQAVCAPSRISVFTGMRPDRTKVRDLRTNMRDMNPDIVTLPQFLKKNGYETVGLGKLMHGARGNDKRSWTIPYKEDKALNYAKGYKYPADGSYQRADIQATLKEAEKQNLNRKGVKAFMKSRGMRPSTECIEVPDGAYSDGAIANAGVELLEKLSSGSKPFFLALGFHKPHLPFVAPKKYWDMYDREKVNINPFQQHAKNSPKYAYHNWGELRNYSDIPRKGGLTVAKQKELIHGYWAAVSYSDAQVGKVIDKLEELGIADNTIVVLWGDHGWHLGDHGLWCKHSNFEQATKAPLIVVAPGYSQGKSAYTMAEFVDIFPTLIDYAGFEIPENLEGNSLLPALQDTQVEIKDYAISQFPRGKDILGYSIRTKRYRLTLWLKGEFEHVDLFKDPVIEAVELYDYEKDPAEQVSLADNLEYSKVVEELKIKLLTLLNEQVE
jgi:arylsulfatase A-like enzyme